jgi:Ca2+/Na+ antiporter
MIGLLPTISGPVLSMLAAACLLIAALSAMLAASIIAMRPGWRAVLNWIPIAVAVLITRCMGWPQIAVGLVFGTSVALLSVGIGSITAVAPIGPAPQGWRRIWPFTLVAAILVFLSGFTGSLPWTDAVALLVEGMIVFSLWNDPQSENAFGSPAAPVAARDVLQIAAWIIAAIFVAGLGGVFIVHGMTALRQQHPQISPGITAASLLSPCLIIPLLPFDRHVARQGAGWVAVSGLVGMVLLNLCLLLPVLAMAPYVREAMHIVSFSPLMIDLRAYAPRAMIYPWGVWRLDAMLLLILAAFFAPVGLGKWNLTRRDGVALSLIYLIYLIVLRGVVG